MKSPSQNKYNYYGNLIKFDEKEWACSELCDLKSLYNILTGNSDGRMLRCILKHVWEFNIKSDLTGNEF